MLKTIGKVGLAAIAGSSLLTTGALVGCDSAEHNGVEDALTSKEVIGAGAADEALRTVEGDFSYNQDEVSSNAELKKAFESSKYLCGSQYDPVYADDSGEPLDWQISVGGTVDNEFVSTMGDLSSKGTARVTMGCVCVANGAGGFAAINANIEGVSLNYITKTAGVGADINTIVFTSADGYEIALPMSYVEHRNSMIVYEVNGAPLRDSVGGTNQLWLGSTPGSYFGRDIVSISYEKRDTPPPNPYTPEGEDYYGNFPGIGIMSAES